ncbi:MAG TPA: SURF1 family protein, partial [Legionellaceae bacterium]|nr:SURF1 family protein [Legionellaceae bacterium]
MKCMISLPGFRLTFTFSWKMLFLALLCIGIFIRLGFWQLHRAEEKRQLLKIYHHQQTLPPRSLTNIRTPMPYQVVKVEGQFLNTNLLLDNQYHAHQFGYDVITPMLLKNGSIVLIDRGWCLGDATRLSFPKIKTPKDTQIILGHVYFPSKKQWLLGPNIDQRKNNLLIIETINIAGLSQFLHKSLYPFIIRQSADSKSKSNEYIRDWAIIAVAP